MPMFKIWIHETHTVAVDDAASNHDDVNKWKQFPRHWRFCGNSPVTGFTKFDVFFDLSLNKWDTHQKCRSRHLGIDLYFVHKEWPTNHLVFLPSMVRKMRIPSTFRKPISTYYMSNCLSFHDKSIYGHHYHVWYNMGPSNKSICLCERAWYYFWDSVENTNMWKLQIQRCMANFPDINLWKHIDFMNKCSMYEYDCFKNVLSSITNNEKWAILKLFIA